MEIRGGEYLIFGTLINTINTKILQTMLHHSTAISPYTGVFSVKDGNNYITL